MDIKKTISKLYDKFPFKEKTEIIDNYKIHYLEQGEGEDVLLIAGGLGGVFLWRETLTFLSRHNFHVIAVSRIGTDKSDKPHKNFDYTAKEEAVLLNKLCEKTGIKSLNIIGFSRGGSIAFTFSSLFAGKVKKLIVVEPIITPYAKFPFLLKLVYISLFIPFLGDIITFITRKTIYSRYSGKNIKKSINKLQGRSFKFRDRIVARKILLNSFTEDLEHYGEGIKCHVYLMLGEKSQFNKHMKKQLIRLKEIIKDFTFDTFKDAPHSIPFVIQKKFFFALEKHLVENTISS